MRPKKMQLFSLMFIKLWDLEKGTVENSFNTSADTPPRNSLFGFSWSISDGMNEYGMGELLLAWKIM